MDRRQMFRPRQLPTGNRTGNRFLRLVIPAVMLATSALAACSSSPPPTMDQVRKLVAEDRAFDALEILIPMAQSGDPAAQYELAGFYHYGYVGANDYKKALKWYRASARQGYADAMVGLSVMYLGGQGVGKDPREAFVWLNLAAQYMADKHAVAKIKSVRDEIGRNLTKDDIAFAKAETILLQPDTTSVQPNEAESIDHLPAALPAETTPTAEPLQNVPPDTAPLSNIPLKSTQPTTTYFASPPISTTPSSSALPATTIPATPVPLLPPATTPRAQPAAPIGGGSNVQPVPSF
jgi:hypothetical protein